MAINVKVNKIPEETKLGYPLLMESKFSDLIVLMVCTGTAFETGIGIVIQGDEVWEIGTQSAQWAMDNFKPFTGTIELSNK